MITTSFAARMYRFPIMASIVLAAATPIGLPTAAKADTAVPKTCTVAGMALYRDPVFVSSLHHTQRDGALREVACAVETTQDLVAGDIHIRLTLGRLYDGRVGGPLLGVRLVTIETIDAAGATQVGRVMLGADPLTSEMRFEPQVKAIDSGVLIRLSRRHRWIFQLQDRQLTPHVAFTWRSHLADAFPDGASDGANLSVDLETMEGRIAVRARGNIQGAPLASAYGENHVVVAKLAWRDGALVAESSQTILRKRDEEPFLDQMEEMDESIRQKLKGIPAGTEPCSLGAWSNDTDPKGLNVRAAPNAQAKVLGIVPPPRKLPKDDAFGDEPAKAEFRIIGYQQGWFLVEAIQAPGVRYGVSYPSSLPQPFKGRGWISSRMAGAAYANGGLPGGRLYLSPRADAAASDIPDENDDAPGVGGSPSRILACSGSWALVEAKGGQRGWWRALCSNQVTNCS